MLESSTFHLSLLCWTLTLFAGLFTQTRLLLCCDWCCGPGSGNVPGNAFLVNCCQANKEDPGEVLSCHPPPADVMVWHASDRRAEHKTYWVRSRFQARFCHLISSLVTSQVFKCQIYGSPFFPPMQWYKHNQRWPRGQNLCVCPVLLHIYCWFRHWFHLWLEADAGHSCCQSSAGRISSCLV